MNQYIKYPSHAYYLIVTEEGACFARTRKEALGLVEDAKAFFILCDEGMLIDSEGVGWHDIDRALEELVNKGALPTTTEPNYL